MIKAGLAVERTCILQSLEVTLAPELTSTSWPELPNGDAGARLRQRRVDLTLRLSDLTPNTPMKLVL